MSTFSDWLAWQELHDDPIGDLARDLSVDTCAQGLTTGPGLLNHILKAHAPDDRAIAAFTEAFTEWDKAMWVESWAAAWDNLWAAA